MEELKTVKLDSPHSVSIKMSTKGVWSAEVKAYGESPKLAMAEALIIANKLQEICKIKNTIGVEKDGKLI